jgi:hypothetical protein
VLNPDGLLYIAVPDLWQEFAPKSVHFIPHLYWYSTKALMRVLQANGFSVIQHAAGREIEILGRVSDAAKVNGSTNEGLRGSFLDRVRDSVLADFGTSARQNSTIIWYKGNHLSSRYWERKTYPGTRLIRSATDLARRVIALMPGRLRRLVTLPFPNFLRGYITSPNCGILAVHRLTPTSTLPVTIRHRSTATAWVK